MNIEFNIPYSKYFPERRIMDLFLPDEPNNCAILFIHGGGWYGGQKESWHPVAEYFAGCGFTCASMEYRLSGQAAHPAQIEDVRLGMAYFRNNAKTCNFDPERIAVIGSSAGGHLTALLSTIDSGSSLGATPELDDPDTRPNAAVLYCPVTTICRLNGVEIVSEAIKLFMNNRSEQETPDVFREASPLERITGNEPPMLLLHGDSDEIVPLFHSEAMVRRLKQAGIYAELHVLSGVKHGFGYGVETGAQQQALAHIRNFLKSQFMLH